MRDELDELPPDAQALDRLLRERHSCRGFLPDQVPAQTIDAILEMAQRSASWCNTQPWQVIITRSQGTEALRSALIAGAVEAQLPMQPDFEGPSEYRGVYGDRRREGGWGLYKAVGVARGDRAASHEQMNRNFALFGAPHVAIITSDGALGTYGAVDCGLYIGTFLLAAQAMGVGCVPQAALAMYSPVLREHFSIPEDRKIVAGISFGFEDDSHAANSFRTSRAPMDEVVRWAEG